MQWSTSRLSLTATIQLGMFSTRIHGMYTLKRYRYGTCSKTPEEDYWKTGQFGAVVYPNFGMWICLLYTSPSPRDPKTS
eukprot:3338925-Ditylum_brightwellii.AAC.1